MNEGYGTDDSDISLNEYLKRLEKRGDYNFGFFKRDSPESENLAEDTPEQPTPQPKRKEVTIQRQRNKLQNMLDRGFTLTDEAMMNEFGITNVKDGPDDDKGPLNVDDDSADSDDLLLSPDPKTPTKPSTATKERFRNAQQKRLRKIASMKDGIRDMLQKQESTPLQEMTSDHQAYLDDFLLSPHQPTPPKEESSTAANEALLERRKRWQSRNMQMNNFFQRDEHLHSLIFRNRQLEVLRLSTDMKIVMLESLVQRLREDKEDLQVKLAKERESYQKDLAALRSRLGELEKMAVAE